MSEERNDRIVDWVLGELDEEAARDMRRDASENPELAQEAAALSCLFEDLRDLSCEPSGRIPVVIRSAMERRARLRKPEPRLAAAAGIVYCLKVAAVAAFVVGAVLLGDRVFRHFGADGLADEFDAVPRVVQVTPDAPPVELRSGPESVVSRPAFLDEPSLSVHYGPLAARVENTSRAAAWALARNYWAELRREYRSRFDPLLRRRAIRAAGGSAYLEARIDRLTDEVAAKIDVEFDAGLVTVASASMALRALVVGGSTLRIGEHKSSVRRCSEWLFSRLDTLEGGELATALSGLMEVAVVSGPQKARVVGDAAARLVEQVLHGSGESGAHRPSILNWQTSPSQLADAGQVLRMAPVPALGVDSSEVLRARCYLAAHVEERIAASAAERPDLMAALLYGYGDLVPRDRIEGRLALWKARELVPEHYVALVHVAWSRYPVRSGWADFQRELRFISAMPTPDSTVDAGALLLALATNYAAPGSFEILALDGVQGD